MTFGGSRGTITDLLITSHDKESLVHSVFFAAYRSTKAVPVEEMMCVVYVTRGSEW